MKRQHGWPVANVHDIDGASRRYEKLSTTTTVERAYRMIGLQKLSTTTWLIVADSEIAFDFT
jgi:hypothetical protein